MAKTLIIPPYRAALLTAADGSPVIRSNGPDSEPVLTEKQWYMFWQNLADQLAANTHSLEGIGDVVTFGNHADRPDPGPWPDGALYVEQDRGSVIYQNQGGVWQYIAGIMYGTLVPDQRPADLGPAADAGFQFRTNVDPAQAFVWSGGDWIETTPIRYGTHAERLAETIANLVSGMLWMETDRGSVIYQNQGGTWLFLTGTMWGTIVPDQRPTDLGVHDAGFDFRSTVAPPREFIWNQVAWVEVTNISGAPGLTHPNVVTRVGAAGEIVEGGITDLSAANSGAVKISAAGNVGIGKTPAVIFEVAYAGGFTAAPAIQGSTQSALKFSSASGGSGFAVGRSIGGADGQDFWIFDVVAGQFRINITGTGNVGLGGVTNPTFQFQLGADSAAKPATSTWSVVSDITLKQNIEPVKDDSLAILDKLEWVRYEYNGQASTPKGTRGIGLVAQALRPVLPEAVRSAKTKLNETDDAETDVLAIDYHHVLVHSARAIQQLSAEVKRLGALLGKPA